MRCLRADLPLGHAEILPDKDPDLNLVGCRGPLVVRDHFVLRVFLLLWLNFLLCRRILFHYLGWLIHLGWLLYSLCLIDV